jgi:ribosomal protein S12 methylthiotransferase
MRTKSLKKNKINVITLGCSKTYMTAKSNGSTTCQRKDVAHEAPAAEEGNIIVITCGFIDNAKAESVNMILEYADKEKRFSRQGFVTGCLSERYRPDLEKKFLMWINILERLNYLHY